jgi:hypothetical protein
MASLPLPNTFIGSREYLAHLQPSFEKMLSHFCDNTPFKANVITELALPCLSFLVMGKGNPKRKTFSCCEIHQTLSKHSTLGQYDGYMANPEAFERDHAPSLHDSLTKVLIALANIDQEKAVRLALSLSKGVKLTKIELHNILLQFPIIGRITKNNGHRNRDFLVAALPDNTVRDQFIKLLVNLLSEFDNLNLTTVNDFMSLIEDPQIQREARYEVAFNYQKRAKILKDYSEKITIGLDG